MKKTLVQCHHCEGSGKIPLARVMQEALAAVTPVPRSTLDIAKAIGDGFVQATAINNRLAHLRTLGLVVSERRGKDQFWTRKP